MSRVCPSRPTVYRPVSCHFVDLLVSGFFSSDQQDFVATAYSTSLLHRECSCPYRCALDHSLSHESPIQYSKMNQPHIAFAGLIQLTGRSLNIFVVGYVTTALMPAVGERLISGFAYSRAVAGNRTIGSYAVHKEQTYARYFYFAACNHHIG